MKAQRNLFTKYKVILSGIKYLNLSHPRGHYFSQGSTDMSICDQLGPADVYTHLKCSLLVLSNNRSGEHLGPWYPKLGSLISGLDFIIYNKYYGFCCTSVCENKGDSN